MSAACCSICADRGYSLTLQPAVHNLKFGGKPHMIWQRIEPPSHRYGVPRDNAFAVPVTCL
jgi:hypothetical protein